MVGISSWCVTLSRLLNEAKEKGELDKEQSRAVCGIDSLLGFNPGKMFLSKLCAAGEGRKDHKVTLRCDLFGRRATRKLQA